MLTVAGTASSCEGALEALECDMALLLGPRLRLARIKGMRWRVILTFEYSLLEDSVAEEEGAVFGSRLAASIEDGSF